MIAKLLRRFKVLGWLKADFTRPHRLTKQPIHADPNFLQTVIRDRVLAIQQFLAHAWTRFSRKEKVSCLYVGLILTCFDCRIILTPSSFAIRLWDHKCGVLCSSRRIRQTIL